MSEKDALIVAQQQRIAELETRVEDMTPMHALGMYFSPTMSFDNECLTITFPYYGKRQTICLRKEDYLPGAKYSRYDTFWIFRPRRDHPVYTVNWKEKTIRLDCRGFIITLVRFESLDGCVSFPFAPTDFDRFDAVLRRAAAAWAHAGM